MKEDKDETQHETIEEQKPSWEEVWSWSWIPAIPIPTPTSIATNKNKRRIQMEQQMILNPFYQLLKEIGDLHHKKQQDYGTSGDPFANIRGSQEWGIKPWVGAMVRAQDKIKRIQKYAREGNLANESVRDSFMDLAVYALIACILHEEEINAN